MAETATVWAKLVAAILVLALLVIWPLGKRKQP